VTVNVEPPYANFVGNGVTTIFPFSFGYVESLDIYVLLDGVTLSEFSGYTIATTDNDEGGEVVFVTAPAVDALVQIIRFTTRSQQVDYESFSSFPADTHEWNLDKDTYILQELIGGSYQGFDTTGNPIFITFNLTTFLEEYLVRIDNSGGTDAELPMWVSNTTAGVYAGTFDLAANIPADESATTEPDGYIWLGY
jgi:hypothetical protein